MLRLFRYLCTVFNIIAYDKHDNRTIPSDLRWLEAKRAQCPAVLWEHQPYREPFLLLEGQNTGRILAFILWQFHSGKNVREDLSLLSKDASGKALCEIEYPNGVVVRVTTDMTLDQLSQMSRRAYSEFLKILQESWRILLNFKSILKIRENIAQMVPLISVWWYRY